jgi:glycosyltransferase involved in cell wall biosynthesis
MRAMRIGIMLRSLDEKGGIGVYSRYLTEELLNLDRKNHYVLFYRDPSHLGRYAHYESVTERVVRGSNNGFWDQVAIPYAAWKADLDVLFHPKFTVPLLAPCKTVMVLHGAGWFMPEGRQFWNRWDLKYVRMMMPVYCGKASAVISVSQITTDTFNRLFHLPDGKITTVYFGPGKHFARVKEVSALQQVKAKYRLPDRFILTLAKYGDGGRKNTRAVFEAYEQVHGKIPHKLVVVGKDSHRLSEDHKLPRGGYGKDIHFTGWVEQEDLPAFYSLAELFLYPSNVEAFPIPITEAMACGTPIITSNVNGLKEIAGEAALFVDPSRAEAIAAEIHKVLLDSDLRRSLSAKALERAKTFRWEKCARETLAILERVASQSARAGAVTSDERVS